MGVHINSDGKVAIKRSDKGESGGSLLSDSIKALAKEAVIGTGSAAMKATVIGGAGVAVGSAVAGGGSAAVAVGAGAAVTVVAVDAMQQEKPRDEKTSLERTEGGVPYQQVLQTTPDSSKESTQPVTTDPFEAFRQCMAQANLQSVDTVNTDLSCLPQKQVQPTFSLPSYR